MFRANLKSHNILVGVMVMVRMIVVEVHYHNMFRAKLRSHDILVGVVMMVGGIVVGVMGVMGIRGVAHRLGQPNT